MIFMWPGLKGKVPDFFKGGGDTYEANDIFYVNRVKFIQTVLSGKKRGGVHDNLGVDVGTKNSKKSALVTFISGSS